MHECRNRGVFETGDRPWTDQQIAVAIGGDISENLRCIQELLDAGVISRNKSGAIYSRRIVREEQKRKNNASRQQDHRDKKKQHKSNATVTPESQHSSSSVSSSKKETTTCASFEAPVSFEEFYSLYPKKKARADALKAWETLWKKGIFRRKEDWEQRARPALIAQLASDDWCKENGAYVPLPATWLRGRRWEDQLQTRVNSAGGDHWSELPRPSKMN